MNLSPGLNKIDKLVILLKYFKIKEDWKLSDKKINQNYTNASFKRSQKLRKRILLL